MAGHGVVVADFALKHFFSQLRGESELPYFYVSIQIPYGQDIEAVFSGNYNDQ